MNRLQLTAVLKKDAIFTRDKEGNEALLFTVCNTEKVSDRPGHGVRKWETWVDCVWWQPAQWQMPLFKARSLVYLEGQVSLRAFRRKDRSKGLALHLDVTYGSFRQQFQGPLPVPPANLSDKNC